MNKELIVIYEQIYDLVNIYDIITEDCFDEYIKDFYDNEVNRHVEDIRTFHFINKPIIKEGSVDWIIKADLKPINEWSDKYESLKKFYNDMDEAERNKCYPKTAHISFGFQYIKFGGLNNFKNLYKNGSSSLR